MSFAAYILLLLMYMMSFCEVNREEGFREPPAKSNVDVNDIVYLLVQLLICRL